MKRLTPFLMFISTAFLLLGICAPHASAGFLDKLDEATKKLNQATQQMQATTQRVQQGAQGGTTYGGGSLSAGLGATNLDYLSKANACMDPLKGYRWKLTADKLEQKRYATPGLTPQEMADWDADIAAVRQAQATGASNIVSPDPTNANRYLERLTSEEQVAINSEFGAFYNQIMSQCNGADHMGIGVRRQMNYTQGAGPSAATAAAAGAAATASSAIPVPPSAQGYDAANLAYLKNVEHCYDPLKTQRWKLIADKLDMKMKLIGNSLAVQDRQAWLSDIAVVREAEQKALAAVTVVDPAKPLRYLERLTPEDHAAINQEYTAFSNELMTRCNSIQ